MNSRTLLLIIGFLVLSRGAGWSADSIITLKSGAVLHGEVVADTNGVVKVKIWNATRTRAESRVLLRSEIKEVQEDAISLEKINAGFGLPLWSEQRLWEETPADVIQRWEGYSHSTKRGLSPTAVISVVLAGEVLGAQPERWRVSQRNGKVSAVDIIYANKGDSVPYLGPQSAYKSGAEYNKVLLAHQKAIATLTERIRQASAAVRTNLTALLGEPERIAYGAGGTAVEDAKMWRWKEYAILLSQQPHESLILRIVSVEQAQARGRSKSISATELKQALKKNVRRSANGDVVVTGIPMIDQGGKGYCVPTTWSRYLQYAGIEVDEYVLANAAQTGAGGGTSLNAMVDAVQSLVARYRRRIIAFEGTFSVSLIAQSIDQGLPIMWGMYSAGPFKGKGRPPSRMEGMTPEVWSQKLKPFRRAAGNIPQDPGSGHMCLLIGYNKLTKEVATSDSWGAGHEEKWYTLEEVQRVSTDQYWTISW